MRLTALDDAAWDSPWRHRSVGAKVACSLGLVLVALVAPTWPGTLLVAVLALAWMLLGARIPARVVARAMAAPLLFLLLGAVSVLVSVGGSGTDDWWRWGVFGVGSHSVAQAVGLLAHGVAGTLAVMLLATTTPLVDLLTWLRRLHVPAPLLEIASLTYRLIFVLLDTVVTVNEAQRARLGDAPAGEGAFRRRFENSASSLGVVAMRSWHRATRLNDGMINRGFESDFATLAPQQGPSVGLYAIGATATIGAWLLSWAVAGQPFR